MKKLVSVFAASLLTVSIASAAVANQTSHDSAAQGEVAEQVNKMKGERKGMKGRYAKQGGSFLSTKSLEHVQVILELSDDQVTQITAIMDNAKGERQFDREALKVQLASGEITKDDIKALRAAKKEEKKAEREALKAQLASGEITKDEIRANREAKKAEMRAKRDDVKAQIEALLTAEQIEKLEALKKLQMKQKGKKGKHRSHRG